MNIEPIAKIYTDFKTKFGIPRQSRRVKELYAKIVFEKEFRNDECIRGIEQFSHLWLIWEFSENTDKKWSNTVRPPRLGGNKRVGVFATRSPFRPNSLGLSCVELIRVEDTANDGKVLIVSGADIMNGTPIYDIKPYIPYSDCVKDAKGGFSSEMSDYKLEVVFPSELESLVAKDKINALKSVLSDDPRPSYQNDDERVYGFFFADYEIKFKVNANTLTVVDVIKT